MIRTLSRRAGVLALIAGVLAGSLAADRLSAQSAERLEMSEREITLADGSIYTFERGVLRVPQNRARPDGPVIELEFHRFPARPGADPGTPPIVHLNGGPGWPGFGAELARAEWFEQNVFPRARWADMIVIGQRGIGSSGPDTACDRPQSPGPPESTTAEARLAAAVEAARACREKWEAEGVDLKSLNVVEAANDVRDVVEALGYERVQIHGGSFGSHWGMAVMRYHPDIVARALLNGMEGPDHTYDMPGWVLSALERVAADAEASDVFDGRIPEGGLIAGFRDVIARAEHEPIAVSLPRRAGRETIDVQLNGDHIRGLWSGFTPAGGGHRMRGWAADMIRLYEGDFEAAANAALMRSTILSIPTAAYFMLDCGSGISQRRLARLLEDPGVEVVGQLGTWYLTLCPVWDADLGEDFRRDFDTDIPTVIVHGNWDTSTPLENALELRPHFTDHRFVLVERGTHGAMGEALRASPRFREALDRYMATGDRSGFPEVVTLPALDWLPPPGG